ncbi:hypothetical protein [Paraburkholderia sp. BL21I4N1]|uniref:hypothetical protein n=1 Tax=Paraburkholderia sp. BL21I4N1 TaxID=1938801 RepID=UPI000D438A7D|nr:hypothetical protein [Paraburkholderia sp. BL21I4N1]PQV53143.1 hypothetical protein B0G83_102228 [Paraburkholderia sp. BL21I4N1]
MMDLLVQLAVAAGVLAMVILLVVSLEPRANLRERILHAGVRRHWWNRHRNGH